MWTLDETSLPDTVISRLPGWELGAGRGIVLSDVRRDAAVAIFAFHLHLPLRPQLLQHCFDAAREAQLRVDAGRDRQTEQPWRVGRWPFCVTPPAW